MANKSIKELPKATQIQEDDALPMQQGSTTKQVTGLTLTLWLLAMADGHGGVTDFQKLSESGLEKTYQFTMVDTTKYTFTVTDGNGVADFQHSVSGLVHTYKLIMDNGQEYTMTIKDGEKGDKGDNAYVWFRFASEKPTSSSSSMGEEADDWIGFYSGNKPTAPTDPMEYVWAPFRGRQGLTGAPATLIRSVVEYQVSTSATVEPSGNWSESIPVVPQGSYLWSRTTIQFNTGGIIQILNKSRDGLDGLGSVVSVNNISPGGNGNVELTADDVGAVPKSGGTMTGPINMAGQPITGLNPPTEDTQVANKGYVDGAFRTAAPVNLLDNSNFMNPVNQRGLAAYSEPGRYFIDRWVLDCGNSVQNPQVTLTKDGIKVSMSGPTGYIGITQNIATADLYKGQRMTAAVKTKEYGICVAHFTIGENHWEYFDNEKFYFIHFNSTWVYFRSEGGTSDITYMWAAIYPGEYTADTLPEYQPKGYAAELAECQRYCYILKNFAISGYFTASAKDFQSDTINAVRNMRATPTLAINGTIVVRTVSGYSTASGFDTSIGGDASLLSGVRVGSNGIRISFPDAATNVNNSWGSINISGTVSFFADL